MDLKWTKFKSKVPQSHCSYVTDWVSVWVVSIEYLLNKRWESYADDNPEYAWAEIPVPEAPKEPKELHLCKDERTGYGCVEDEGSLLFLGISAYRVDFCPFCGFSIKDKK